MTAGAHRVTAEEATSRSKSALATRLTFGIPILSVVIGLLWWDHSSGNFFGLRLLALFFGVGGTIEFCRMSRLPRSLTIASVLWVLLLLGSRAALAPGESLGIELDLLLLASAPFLFLVLSLRREPNLDALRQVACALFAVLYVGLPLVCLLELGTATQWGLEGLMFLVLVVKGNDSGAYLVGRKWGKTPLIRVSPKKTREGSLGGVALGIAIGGALWGLGAAGPFSLFGAIVVAIAIGIAGQLGDLVESFLKRSTGVKDSGSLIPQFGGVLDLLDSILFAAPVLLLVVQLVAL